MLKNQRGQVLVEFAICIVLFFLFVFGLISAAMWGVTSYLTQEVAHEVARKYAVTGDSEEAKKKGEYFISKTLHLFIVPETVGIEVFEEGTSAKSTVTVEPVIKKYFSYHINSITKTSHATMEHHIRSDGKDKYIGGEL